MRRKERAFRKGAKAMQAKLITWLASAGQPEMSREVAAMELPAYFSRRDRRVAALVDIRLQTQRNAPAAS